MAQKTAALHKDLVKAARDENGIIPELWLVGYAELKKGRIFIPYKETLSKEYQGAKDAWDKVFVFQHFSMNRFTIDLKEHSDTVSLEAIHELGNIHKKEIFAR